MIEKVALLFTGWRPDNSETCDELNTIKMHNFTPIGWVSLFLFIYVLIYVLQQTSVQE